MVGFAVGVTAGATGCSAMTSSAMTSRPHAVEESVVLVPGLSAGEAGWCLLTLRVASEAGGCGATRRGFPVIAERSYGGSTPPEAGGIVLTTSSVAAVSVNGSAPLKTRTDALLPRGLRAVVWEITGKGANSHRVPHIVPLDWHGETMGSSRDGPIFHAELPSTNIAAGVSVTGPCTITAGALAGLKNEGESIVTFLHGIPGLLGEAFLACAKAEYQLSGWPINASVLVDARNPGVAPPRLPGMKAVRGRNGVSAAPGTEGPQVAHRIQGGWLVVSGGRSQAQRLVLLEHLRAKVT
jgi:hypothetical protein